MKYSVGDIVRIRDGLVIGEEYNNRIRFTCDMNNYCGETARVESVLPWLDGYRLNIDNQKRLWTDDMLDHVNPQSDYVQEETKSSNDAEDKALPFEVRKICKLIGALRLAGVEEFTLSYSYGEIRCSAEMDISGGEDG